MTGPTRILHVDDYQLDRELVRDALEQEQGGFVVTQAASRQEFEARLTADAYDVVVSDFNILGFDGLGVLDAVRAVAPDTPVVIVTGTGSEEIAVEALKRGAADYVLKSPLHIRRLPQTIHAVLDKQRVQQEREQAEQRIATLLRFQNEMLDTAAAWIDTLDTAGNITFWNRAAERISGYRRDEVMGHSRVWEWLYPDLNDRTRVFAKTMPIIQQGERGENFETVIRGKNGQKHVIAWYSNNLVDETRQVVGSIALGIDITLRKQAEDELHRAHEMLRTVLDTIPQRVAWRDRNAIYLGANKAFARDAGLTEPEAILGKRDADLIWRAYADTFEAEDRKIIATDTSMPPTDTLLVLPDGTQRWQRISKAPLHDPNGAVMGLLDSYEDITEEKLANQKLLQTLEELATANADLERFAYVASHDLQEPLRMVASFVQLLGQRYHGQLDADADEFIGFAVEGAQRMQQLINDLLAYSRIGARGQSFRPVDAEAALSDALWNLSLAIEDAGAVVTHDPLPIVLADPTQLLQLLQNLIGNAIKFRGEAAPVVHVSARLQIADCRLQIDEATAKSEIANLKSEWLFAVRDNGIGIAPEYHERIFGVFQRLHARSAYSGTGIGLAICKRVVERHGGRIWVESQVGQGAAFCFTLSATPEAA